MLNRINKVVVGNGGFTIIELVAVLVVMAIMASFAIAKFVAVGDEAKGANGAGVALVNALNAAERQVHNKALLSNSGLWATQTAFQDDTYTAVTSELGSLMDDGEYVISGGGGVPATHPLAVAGVTINYQTGPDMLFTRGCTDNGAPYGRVACTWSVQ
jgi:prepilin-type N-terminal cleavage/methylation domain-containing protein